MIDDEQKDESVNVVASASAGEDAAKVTVEESIQEVESPPTEDVTGEPEEIITDGASDTAVAVEESATGQTGGTEVKADLIDEVVQNEPLITEDQLAAEAEPGDISDASLDLDLGTDAPRNQPPLDQDILSMDDLEDDDSIGMAESVDITHPLVQDIILEPTRWRIWPAIAVLRWLLRKATKDARRIVYRSEPSLHFTPSEINDVAVDSDGIELILNAPGIAAPGSPLPSADIERIIKDKRNDGAIAAWLDGPGDRFMHALEAAQARNNVAFAIATGGRIESLHLMAKLVGFSAPLIANAEGALSATWDRAPEGAVGLSAMYLGPISAKGMENLFHAVTGLPTSVKEFTGREVPVVRPARLGRGFHSILGVRCHQPDAGIEIVIKGGSDPESLKWLRDRARRHSLHLLASSYIGSPSPRATLFMLLNADNAPTAVLEENATVLGGLSVLGKPQVPVFVPVWH